MVANDETNLLGISGFRHDATRGLILDPGMKGRNWESAQVLRFSGKSAARTEMTPERWSMSESPVRHDQRPGASIGAPCHDPLPCSSFCDRRQAVTSGTQLGLESEEGAGDPAWDDAVRACAGSVFHSTSWARYIIRQRPNTTPVRFRLLSDVDAPLGVALGFLTRPTRRFLAPLTSQLWFDSLPAVSAPLTARFVELLEASALNLGCLELAFGSYAYRGGSEVLRTRGYTLTDRLEFELDLAPDEKDLWRAMEHKRRKNVNKSRAAGVVVEEMPPAGGLTELYRLHEIGWVRIQRRGVAGSGGLEAARGDRPERELIEAGVGRLVGARLDREWVTVSLFTRFADQVYHLLSGHSPRALEVQAPTQLLWETILRYRSEGVRWFNFGGCPASAREPGSPQHGVMDYKRAFGGVCLECASGSRVIRPTRAAVARALRRITSR